jgi:hypothetical protein
MKRVCVEFGQEVEIIYMQLAVELCPIGEFVRDGNCVRKLHVLFAMG